MYHVPQAGPGLGHPGEQDQEGTCPPGAPFSGGGQMRKTWVEGQRVTHRPGLYQMGTSVLGGGWGHHSIIVNFSKELTCELRLTSRIGMLRKGELPFPAESM